MHHLALLLSKFSLQVKISYQIASVSNAPFSALFSIFPSRSKISFQIPSECTIYRRCFHFSAFPNRLKYCHKAPFTSLVFIIYLFFAAVQNIINTTSVHALKTISMNNISLQYQIFSNTDRMHAYSETFSKFTVQYQIVQIPSRCML